MTMEKKQKIRKIKRIRIWPAIVGFLISVTLLFGLLMSCVSIMIMYVLENAYASKFDAAHYIAESIQRDYKRGIPFDVALENFNTNRVCIIDKDNNVVAPTGNLNIDFNSELEVGLTQNRTFFGEFGMQDDWISEDGELLPNIGVLTGNLFSGGYTGENWLNGELHSIDCWMVMPTDMDDYRLLVKAEVKIIRKDVLFILIMATSVIILSFIPLIIMFINVFSSVRAQRQMHNLFYFDEVTGGKNWSYFKDVAKKEITRYKNRNKTYAVVDLELMKYRSLCAYCGVDEGEHVLEQVNNAICANIAKRDICTRYARANYALLIACKNEDDAREKIEKLIDVITKLTSHHRVIFHAGYCMIDALLGSDDKAVRKMVDIPAVYNSASAARSSITNVESNAVAAFTSKLLEDQIWEHKVEEEMQNALDNREFAVYYQPKYNPVTGELAGAEALIRWVKPEGLVPPGRFIPIFEKNGFITKIDDYMIDNVARQQAKWLEEGKNIVPVSVNVSRAHFMQEDLAEHILGIVDRYDIPHKYIEIELTESAFFDDKKALLGTVKKLKEYGFEISMDDFGAGYSSLNSLKDLPLDVLKLDADFFRGEDNNDRADIVVTEAISLGKMLNMRIVAEGIEKKNQVDFLAGVGCDMIQGYYFAKPMPASEYEERMEQHHAEMDL